LQIRCLLYSWIDEWMDLMSSYQVFYLQRNLLGDEVIIQWGNCLRRPETMMIMWRRMNFQRCIPSSG
jgi:hypothetical protein